jgi:hypothetical protein
MAFSRAILTRPAATRDGVVPACPAAAGPRHDAPPGQPSGSGPVQV